MIGQLSFSDGRIQIARQISAGKYFAAYEADDTLLDRRVFLKVERNLGPEVARDIVEAHIKLWRELGRQIIPGVPPIFDFGYDKGRCYLVTEWIDAPSLRSLIDAGTNTNGDRGRFLNRLLRQCLVILQALHERGFVHGDISPSNILVGPDPHLVDPAPPLDLPDPDDPSRRLILATPDFLAPEVQQGHIVSPRSDLYSLGLVIQQAADRLASPTPGLVRWLTEQQPQDRPKSANAALRSFGDPDPLIGGISSLLAEERVRFDPWPAEAASAGNLPGNRLLTRIRRRLQQKLADIAVKTVIGTVSTPGPAPTRPVSVPNPPIHPLEVSKAISVPIPSSAPVASASPGASSQQRLKRVRKPRAQTAYDALTEGSTAKLPVSEADFSIVAPNLIQAGRNFIVEVWVAPNGQRDAMLEQATRSGRMVERGSRSHVNLGNDTLITVLLRLPDFEVAEPVETLGWGGDIRNIGFIAKAPLDLAAGIYPGSVKLMQANIPFASIMFDLEVVSAGRAAETSPRPLSAHMQRIARAFASYASQDRAEVLRRVQGIQAAGTEVFLDIINLRTGAQWEQVLFNEIDTSDGFFLFWSRNAAKSEWVDREWRYALSRRGLEFINPLALEDPRLVTPPAELQSKHFNDMILAFIKAEEALGRDSD